MTSILFSHFTRPFNEEAVFLKDGFEIDINDAVEVGCTVFSAQSFWALSALCIMANKI